MKPVVDYASKIAMTISDILEYLSDAIAEMLPDI